MSRIVANSHTHISGTSVSGSVRFSARTGSNEPKNKFDFDSASRAHSTQSAPTGHNHRRRTRLRCFDRLGVRKPEAYNSSCRRLGSSPTSILDLERGAVSSRHIVTMSPTVPRLTAQGHVSLSGVSKDDSSATPLVSNISVKESSPKKCILSTSRQIRSYRPRPAREFVRRSVRNSEVQSLIDFRSGHERTVNREYQSQQHPEADRVFWNQPASLNNDPLDVEKSASSSRRPPGIVYFDNKVNASLSDRNVKTNRTSFRRSVSCESEASSISSFSAGSRHRGSVAEIFKAHRTHCVSSETPSSAPLAPTLPSRRKKTGSCWNDLQSVMRAGTALAKLKEKKDEDGLARGNLVRGSPRLKDGESRRRRISNLSRQNYRCRSSDDAESDAQSTSSSHNRVACRGSISVGSDTAPTKLNSNKNEGNQSQKTPYIMRTHPRRGLSSRVGCDHVSSSPSQFLFKG